MNNYLFIFSCCNKEPVCDVSDFLGTWKVLNDVCSIDNSREVEIFRGKSPARIELKLGSDTLSFIVTNCVARHKHSDFLIETEASLILDGDRLDLEYQSQIAILPVFCFKDLIRSK